MICRSLEWTTQIVKDYMSSNRSPIKLFGVKKLEQELKKQKKKYIPYFMNQKWVIVWKTVQHNMVMDSNENIGYILYIMYSVNVGAFFWPWRAYVFYVKYSRPGKFSPFGWSILFFSYVICSFLSYSMLENSLENF